MVLGVPQESDGKWWPRDNKWRLEIVLRAVVFAVIVVVVYFALKHFGLVGKSTAWYSRTFWTITYYIRRPATWILGTRRNIVMRILYWIWDHIPAVVKAALHFLSGIFN